MAGDRWENTKWEEALNLDIDDGPLADSWTKPGGGGGTKKIVSSTTTSLSSEEDVLGFVRRHKSSSSNKMNGSSAGSSDRDDGVYRSQFQMMDSLVDEGRKSVVVGGGLRSNPSTDDERLSRSVNFDNRIQRERSSGTELGIFPSVDQTKSQQQQPPPGESRPTGKPGPESLTQSLPPRRRPPAAGAPRDRSLPPQYRLPDELETSFQGYLHQLRVTWRRRWLRKLCAIQHNVFLVADKESPFLVSLCIPLAAIHGIEVEANDNSRFNVTYTAPRRHEKTKQTTVSFKASNSLECDQWVTALKFHNRRALASQTPLLDFVVRDEAETKLQQIHGVMRNAGLYSLVTRAFNIVVEKEHLSLCEAFEHWRTYTYYQRMKSERERLDRERTLGDEKLHQAQYEVKMLSEDAKLQRNAHLAVQKLAFVRRKVLHRSFMMLRTRAELVKSEKSTHKMAENIAELYVDVATRDATHKLVTRRQKIIELLLKAYLRRMKWALDTLRINSQAEGARREAVRSKMTSFLCATRQSKKTAQVLIWARWCHWTQQRLQLRDGMVQILRHRQRHQTVAILFYWRNIIIKASTKDVIAIEKLVLAVKNIQNKALSSSFRLLATSSEEGELNEAYQIAANFNVVNQRLLDAFNSLPRDRGVILLVYKLQLIGQRNLSLGFQQWRRSATQKAFLLKTVRTFARFFDIQKRMRMSDSFSKWRRTTTNLKGFESSLLSGLRTLRVIVNVAEARLNQLAFSQLNKNALYLSLKHEKDKFIVSLDKVVQKGRMTAFEHAAYALFHSYERAYKVTLSDAFLRWRRYVDEENVDKKLTKFQKVSTMGALFEKARIVRISDAFNRLHIASESEAALVAQMGAHARAALNELSRADRQVSEFRARKAVLKEEEESLGASIKQIMNEDPSSKALLARLTVSSEDKSGDIQLASPSPYFGLSDGSSASKMVCTSVESGVLVGASSSSSHSGKMLSSKIGRLRQRYHQGKKRSGLFGPHFGSLCRRFGESRALSMYVPNEKNLSSRMRVISKQAQKERKVLSLERIMRLAPIGTHWKFAFDKIRNRVGEPSWFDIPKLATSDDDLESRDSSGVDGLERNSVVEAILKAETFLHSVDLVSKQMLEALTKTPDTTTLARTAATAAPMTQEHKLTNPAWQTQLVVDSESEWKTYATLERSSHRGSTTSLMPHPVAPHESGLEVPPSPAKCMSSNVYVQDTSSKSPTSSVLLPPRAPPSMEATGATVRPGKASRPTVPSWKRQASFAGSSEKPPVSLVGSFESMVFNEDDAVRRRDPYRKQRVSSEEGDSSSTNMKCRELLELLQSSEDRRLLRDTPEIHREHGGTTKLPRRDSESVNAVSFLDDVEDLLRKTHGSSIQQDHRSLESLLGIVLEGQTQRQRHEDKKKTDRTERSSLSDYMEIVSGAAAAAGSDDYYIRALMSADQRRRSSQQPQREILLQLLKEEAKYQKQLQAKNAEEATRARTIYYAVRYPDDSTGATPTEVAVGEGREYRQVMVINEQENNNTKEEGEGTTTMKFDRNLTPPRTRLPKYRLTNMMSQRPEITTVGVVSSPFFATRSGRSLRGN